MKRLLFLVTVFAISSMGFAQGVNGGLKGPAAKNYKFWLDKNKPVATEVVTTSSKPLQGPAAKNKSWHDQDNGSYSTVVTDANRPQLIGPKAKNSKPYKYSGLASNHATEQRDLSSTKEP